MADQNDGDELLFKTIIVGDSGVGKSSILIQFTKNEFKSDYTVTLGVEFFSKLVEIDADTKIKLQMWDTAGQESFKSIVRSFFRNAAAVILVYSVTDLQSFENLQGWLAEAKEYSNPNLVIVLVGNQCDRNDERQVDTEQGLKFQKDNNINLFFETSAKTAENVEIAFKETAKLVFLNYMKEQMEKPKTVESGNGFQSLNINENKGKKLAASPDKKVPPESKSGCCQEEKPKRVCGLY